MLLLGYSIPARDHVRRRRHEKSRLKPRVTSPRGFSFLDTESRACNPAAQLPTLRASGLTVLQLIRSFVTYTRSHPAELEGNTAVAVFKALQHAFPCR